ncbi:MAG TPA: DNA internalization-related competence protein ComEC/Rec2 [Mariprofundaceae bacterium]|nr:DNA internalization-related competence protein ComEC/Rec2 [Mariprofundaceae bacterium]
MAGSSTPTDSFEKLKGAPDWRRLPLAGPVLLFVAGLASARTDLLPIGWAALLIFFITGGLLLARKKILATVLLAGVLWGMASLMADAWRVAADPSWLADWKVEGTVASVEKRENTVRLRLADVRRADGAALHGLADIYLFGKSEEVPVAGQHVAVVAHFKQPENDRNPGAFDYRAWCFDRHIALVGSVRGGITIQDARISMFELVRQRIREAAAGLEPQSAAILMALLLGDRSGIDETTNRLFSATGTAHLLAISGLHMGMAAGWAMALAWWLLTRREAWIVNLPVRRVALTIGVLAAAVYGMLAGWPLPAQRAALMLAAGALAWLLAARTEPLNTLLAALLLILLFDPAAVASLSLWLSFLATAALLMWSVQQQEQSSWQRGITILLSISLLSWLVTLPLVVSAFGRLPLYGLPSNLLLVPLYGFGVMPLALSGELLAMVGWHSGAAWSLSGAASLIAAGQWLLAIIAGWPGSGRVVLSPPMWICFIYGGLLSAAGFSWWKGRWKTAASVAALAVTMLLADILVEQQVDTPTWVVWDVGQGAASSLLLPDGGVLDVDVPGSPGSRFNGGTKVAEGLRALGITHADVLVLSHAQSDHLGGAPSLLQHLNRLGEIWLADVPAVHGDRRVVQIIRKARAMGGDVRWLAAGDSLQWQGVRVDVLWPPRGYRPANANNASLVLHLQLPDGQRLLLPADIEEAAETAMPLPGEMDAMLVPHHGSRTSSSMPFVQSARPGVAIAQTGRENRYRFPAADVVARYRSMGTRVLNTADGAVVLRWSANVVEPEVQIRTAPVSVRRVSALQWWQSHL